MAEKRRIIVHLAVSVGEILLRNGAEIFRVEETISRILDAYGIRDYHLYVLSNGIFVSLDEASEDSCVALRNVAVTAIHLGRIAAVNDLSRSIVQRPETGLLEEYKQRLAACAAVPHFSHPVLAGASGMGSACFCYLLGGGPGESAAAFLCGVLLQVFLTLYGRRRRSRFMHTVLGAALVTSLSVGMTWLLPLSLDHVIIGAIIPLVPGVAFTTSIRDFFNGDFLSGNIHLIEAALTGVCIAVGVGAALQFWPFVMGGVLP